MFKRISAVFIVMLLMVSCSLVNSIPQVFTVAPVGDASSTTNPIIASGSLTATETASPVVAMTSSPVSTPTLAIPMGAIVVNTFDQEVYPFKQNGNCSLGEAIWAAQTQKSQDGCVVTAGSSTIYLPTGSYTLTDADTSSPPLPGAGGRLGFVPGGFPVIYTAMTILGNGSTIQRTGSNKFGIFQVTAGGNLTLNDLTISGGDTTNTDLSEGGALDMLLGQATLNRVTITKNASYDGGGLAIGMNSTLTLNDSVVQGNTATNDGGGIYSGGTLMLKNSVVSSNTAQDQSLGGGGIYNDSGKVSLDHSQLVSNLAFEGGGIYSDSGMVNIVDQSVISGNVATEVSDVPHGGGGINSLDSNGGALVTIKDSFIVGNQAPASIAGGIYVQGSDSNSTILTITNSILSHNSALASGGILIGGGTGWITGSCIVGNKATKVSGNVGGDVDNGNMDQVPFVASNNWWGASDKPGSVSQFVTTAPILTSPPAICAGAIPTPYPTLSGK